jgi:hypothetical protein
MKSLNNLTLLFVLTALPVSAEVVTDSATGLRTGIITVNAQTYKIGAKATSNLEFRTNGSGSTYVRNLVNKKG